MTSYTLRPATQADSAALLRWRNDEVTRRWARTHESIAVADHERWLTAVLSDSRRMLYVVEFEGVSVGSVRLDRSDRQEDEAEVSIAVAPEARGRGVGSHALSAAADQVGADLPGVSQLLAVVHRDNSASLRLFDKAGYTPRTPVDPTWLELALPL